MQVSNLSVARGGVPVLSGLSFALAAGEALVLRGPNGAGKTTLLRCIAGLQAPLTGQIEGAEDRVAYAAHADGLKSMLTVRENLSFWAQVFGNTGISAALDGYALRPLADRLAATLSAGQKRRLGLARLLVTGRPIWVLDEPTVSLDADAVALFGAVLRGHLAAGGSALMATHIDLGVEARMLDISAYRAAPDADLGASDAAFL
ncbi:heme ABC exporter ATP-binding protein CcmA [Sulfitobacter sp. KE29]|uniref:heme ABC exporter ATP-binding protein CcmA n=1 Tax=Sulfitobacter TaxID=60136 RepID=UPI0007C25FEA|nr:MULTISPECIES: heme ABC exporter ATP-binding protein CcmA [unclassified Sulfitobacter]MBO9439434.1 heme ABC exporter ATP-binding protein CcmA [Sulfitobacter sp. R18_2]MDH4539080.1 heme ABC exporter ATP-binding protein CcmA [Sulfitobacter faviae]KZY50873.1 heme ABC transporter ATP-binding protein CcmA [Sulfitobacter sp. HI0054]MDF3416894.1 heme ABC exporter ATP-binding protein CcmA [Sulfitobacter sp. Ks38]MDF3424376.1 heme ABC exporter ATP-binding protein CcmA [Sulfitobacter sp. KE29]